MKKISIVLSLLVAASLLLTACGVGESGESTVTMEPSLGIPGTGGTASPSMTEGTGATATQMATQDMTQEMTQPAGTAVITSTAEVTGTIGTPGIPGTGRLSDDYRLMSVLLTFQLVDANNQVIGDVEDMVMNICEARIDYLIVTADPSMGLGEGSTLIVPFAAVDTDIPGVTDGTQGTPMSTQAASPTANATDAKPAGGDEGMYNSVLPGINNQMFVLRDDITLDVIQNAPVTGAELDILEEDWDFEIRTYWSAQLGYEITTDCMVAGLVSTGALMGTAVAGTPDAPAETATPGSGDGRVAVQKIALATRLRDVSLVDGNGVVLGNVVDMVLNDGLGRVDYLILEPDASLDLPEAGLIAIPSGAFNVQHTEDDWRQPVLVLLVEVSVLTSAPTLSGDINVGNPSWDADVMSYWVNYVPNQTQDDDMGGATSTATP